MLIVRINQISKSEFCQISIWNFDAFRRDLSMFFLLFDDRKFETARRFSFRNFIVIRRFSQMSFALLDIFDEWTTRHSTDFVLWILTLFDVFDRWVVRYSTMLFQRFYRWKVRYSTSLLSDFNFLFRRFFRLEHRFPNNMCESQKFRLCEILKSCEREKKKKNRKNDFRVNVKRLSKFRASSLFDTSIFDILSIVFQSFRSARSINEFCRDAFSSSIHRLVTSANFFFKRSRVASRSMRRMRAFAQI